VGEKEEGGGKETFFFNFIQARGAGVGDERDYLGGGKEKERKGKAMNPFSFPLELVPSALRR